MIEIEPKNAETISASLSKLDLCRLIYHHSIQFKKSDLKAREILSSARKGNRRSVCDDLLAIEEVYNTNFVIEGVQNIPETNGVILAVSHVKPRALRDYPYENPNVNILWWAAGIAKAVRERRGEEVDFRFIARAPSGQTQGLAKRFIDMYGGFPVNHFGSKETMRSLKSASEAAKSGEVILIAPEGEDSQSLIKAKRGIAKLAPSERPFIPVAFWEEEIGNNEFKYRLSFGEPITPENVSTWNELEAQTRKQKEYEFADKIMRGVAKLMPEEIRGEYSVL